MQVLFCKVGTRGILKAATRNLCGGGEKTMVEENILFCYMLTDAWGLRLAKVTVFKDGKVQYKDGKRKESCCKLNEPSLKQIKEILKQHAVIFEYTSSEIEFPNILDGVMNFFTFATQEGESVELMAFNIGEVRNPKGHFLEGFMPTSEKNILNHDVVPVKAINVVKTFDEIAEILVKNGVDSKCLRLTYQ